MICKHCNGEGWVQTSYGKEWSRIFKELVDSGLDILTANEQSIRSMDAKYPNWTEKRIEEICDQCDGTGRI